MIDETRILLRRKENCLRVVIATKARSARKIVSKIRRSSRSVSKDEKEKKKLKAPQRSIIPIGVVSLSVERGILCLKNARILKSTMPMPMLCERLSENV